MLINSPHAFTPRLSLAVHIGSWVQVTVSASCCENRLLMFIYRPGCSVLLRAKLVLKTAGVVNITVLISRETETTPSVLTNIFTKQQQKNLQLMRRRTLQGFGCVLLTTSLEVVPFTMRFDFCISKKLKDMNL